VVKAAKDKRLLITRDKGFGSLTFLGDFEVSGVILLRIKPENQDQVHAELRKVLEAHDERELQKSFCTIEPGRPESAGFNLYDAVRFLAPSSQLYALRC
jgi:hypothetical protein